MSRPIVVLGMHRSGTSFVVRALNLSGLWLGASDALYTVEGRAAPGNPKGNYEHLSVVELNDSILASSGGSWADPPSTLKLTEAQIRQMRELIANLRAEQPATFSRWGWKDPRTTVTFDAWNRILDSGAVLVGTFRHPRPVAESLNKRSGLPLRQGYALWLDYNTRLLRHLEANPSFLVRFDVSLPTLVNQIRRICDSLGLRSNLEGLSRWYDEALVRNTLAGEDDSPEFTSVASIWQALLDRHCTLNRTHTR